MPPPKAVATPAPDHTVAHGYDGAIGEQEPSPVASHPGAGRSAAPDRHALNRHDAAPGESNIGPSPEGRRPNTQPWRGPESCAVQGGREAFKTRAQGNDCEPGVWSGILFSLRKSWWAREQSPAVGDLSLPTPSRNLLQGLI
jgi:hypothetical protein